MADWTRPADSPSQLVKTLMRAWANDSLRVPLLPARLGTSSLAVQAGFLAAVRAVPVIEHAPSQSGSASVSIMIQAARPSAKSARLTA
jgi:hypothetical protein